MMVLIYAINCESVSRVPKRIPREESELDNIYVDKLYEGQKDDATLEAFDYLCDVSEKIANYLKKLHLISIYDYYELMGDWILVDEKLNPITNSRRFFMNYEIQIVNIFHDNLSFSNLDSTTLMYEDKNNDFVFTTNWIRAIRKTKIKDNMMYVYILNGDYWELDPIHSDGKYFFIHKNN